MNMPDRETLELITRFDPSFLLLSLKDTHFDVGLLQKMIDMAKEGARAALAAEQQAEVDADAAFEQWKEDPAYYQWNTNEEHARLNFDAGHRAAQSSKQAGVAESDENNPVEAIGEEFVRAKADPNPRAVDTLTEALDCTLREHGFTLAPVDDEGEDDGAAH